MKNATNGNTRGKEIWKALGVKYVLLKYTVAETRQCLVSTIKHFISIIINFHTPTHHIRIHMSHVRGSELMFS